MPREIDELRKKAEARLKEELLDIPSMSSDEAVKLFQELRTHQIELEMQNEELRRAQLELEEARDKYSDLYDFAPVGYLTISKEGLVVEANLTACTLLGVERNILLKKPFPRFIVKEDQDAYYLHRKYLLEENICRACELRLLGKDGLQFWAELETVVSPDMDESAQWRTAIIDITRRKSAEAKRDLLLKELESSNKRLTKKNRELEKFQKITMGREERILELKKNLKELEKPLKPI